MCLEADIDLLQMDKHSNLGVFSWLAGLLFTIDSLFLSLTDRLPDCMSSPTNVCQFSAV